jgi:protein phosphatase
VDWQSTLAEWNPQLLAAAAVTVGLLAGIVALVRKLRRSDEDETAAGLDDDGHAGEFDPQYPVTRPGVMPTDAGRSDTTRLDGSGAHGTGAKRAPVPRIVYDEVDEEDTPRSADTSGVFEMAKIVFDEDAVVDELTGAKPLFVLSASAHSDTGRHRRRNEDRVLCLERVGVFAVADGMGGQRGGEVASSMAVETIRRAFEAPEAIPVEPDLPRRAGELVQAIRKANAAILKRARTNPELRGMGTTISAARFSARKQRLYIAHVGDSRVYRLRAGRLTRMTNDHTMAELGVTSEDAKNLSRAVGVHSRVRIDVVLAKPQPKDVYLICTDGLTKMVDEARIAQLLAGSRTPDTIARSLIEAANSSGGKDNTSVVLIRIDPMSSVARLA